MSINQLTNSFDYIEEHLIVRLFHTRFQRNRIIKRLKYMCSSNRRSGTFWEYFCELSCTCCKKRNIVFRLENNQIWNNVEKKFLLFFPLLNANITSTLEFVDNEFASIKIGEFNFNARLRARPYSSVASLPPVRCSRDPYWLTNRGRIEIGFTKGKTYTRTNVGPKTVANDSRCSENVYGIRTGNVGREKNDSAISVFSISFRTQSSGSSDDRTVFVRQTSKSICRPKTSPNTAHTMLFALVTLTLL